MPVKKYDSPLLIIGLGGTGSEAAYRVKKAFQERLELATGSTLPPRTRFLIIDSDDGEQKKWGWSSNEFFSISNNYNSIKGKLTPWESMWFDRNFQDSDGLLAGGNGAGVYRQISRLYLFRKVDELLTTIQTAVNDVRTVQVGEDPGKRLQIRVFAGISGGTGSGTILDVPYLIRYALEEQLHMQKPDYSLEGILVMPDVTIQHHATADKTKRDLYQANGYAALKEIDFWMYYESHHHQYLQKYSHSVTINWNCAPYDDLILLNATNLQNALLTNAQEHIMDTIAEYMVNCFSEDYSGNNAIREYNQSQQAQNPQPQNRNYMTFEAERSNTLAQLRSMRKEYFVPYRYRSIGAFSNTGDEINILNRQWNLILNECIQHLDDNQPHMDGTAPGMFRADCLDKAVGCASSSSLRIAYEAIHPVPEVFGNMEVGDLRTMSYSSAPHGDTYETFKMNIEQSRGDDVATLVKKGKKELHEVFVNVVCDLARGPEYCYALLTHATKGLQQAIDEEKKKASEQLRECEGFIKDYSGNGGLCDNMMGEIKELGLIQSLFEANRRFGLYKASVEDLYTATQAAGYYRALTEAIESIRKYIVEYGALLGDMCNGLRTRREEYQKRVNTAKAVDGAAVHLLDNDKLEGSLTATFNENEQKEMLVKKAFQTVADAVDAAMQHNQSGLSDSEVASIIQEGIEAVRRNSFSAINSMSIETKLSTYGSLEGKSMREYTHDIIMPKLYLGASPMFHAAYTLSPSVGNIVESYMGTVPADAINIEMGIDDFMKDKQGIYANLKRSSVPDRLFWVTTVVGMPMMAYAGLNGYYKTYLAKRDSHSGVHLCMHGSHSLDDKQCQNWSLLPEPTCNRYKVMSPEEEEAYELFKAGELDIQVDFTNVDNTYKPYPSVSYKRLHPFGTADYITVESMADMIEDALADKSKMPEREQALNTLREKYDIVDITPENLREKAEAWAVELGLGTDITTELSAMLPKATLEKLEASWRTCFERAACEYVARNPQLRGYMHTNRACFDLIDARIAKESEPDFEAIAENAIVFGRMYRFGLISVTRAGAEFVSEDIPDSSRGLYDDSDLKQEALMKRYYPGFSEYSMRLQNTMYYACMIGGKDRRDTVQREVLDTLEKDYQKMLKSLPDDDDLDIADVERALPGVGGFISNARKLEGLLDKDVKEVTQLYTAGKIGEKERQSIKDVLDALIADTRRFTKTWKGVEV